MNLNKTKNKTKTFFFEPFLVHCYLLLSLLCLMKMLFVELAQHPQLFRIHMKSIYQEKNWLKNLQQDLQDLNSSHFRRYIHKRVQSNLKNRDFFEFHIRDRSSATTTINCAELMKRIPKQQQHKTFVCIFKQKRGKVTKTNDDHQAYRM